MIPSVVFVPALTLLTKFTLSSKFSRNLGSKTSIYVLSTSKKHTTRFLVKSFGVCCGITVMWPDHIRRIKSRDTNPLSQSHLKFFEVESESSHDLVE